MGNETIHLDSSPASLQESKILKARACFLFDRETFTFIFVVSFILVAGFFAEIASALLWAYVPEASFLIIFTGLIWLLIPLSILFFNYPSIVAVMPGKIIIKRPMHNPVMIEKKDIMQISVTKNKNHSLRWLIRLMYVIFLVYFGVEKIMETLQNLEREFPYSVVINLFLVNFILVALLLVQSFKFELVTPYQQTLNVTTHSNLKLKLFTDDPEELTRLLKIDEYKERTQRPE